MNNAQVQTDGRSMCTVLSKGVEASGGIGTGSVQSNRRVQLEAGWAATRRSTRTRTRHGEMGASRERDVEATIDRAYLGYTSPHGGV